MERATVLTPGDLDSLLQPGRGARVSIYLPVHPIKTEAPQDAIRLKNLLRESAAGLDSRGLRRTEIGLLLEEAYSLLDDAPFWRTGGAGLALFASMQGTRAYRLPIEFEELVAVGNSFHIKPLLPLLSGNGHYSLLALSQSRLRLLQGDRWRVRDVTPSRVPTSLEEAMQFDVLDKGAQVHTAGPPRGAGAGRASQFHGHGATERDDKGRILEYFRQVDSGVRERLLRHGGPLVLAGVDYLRSIYREANTYPHLLADGIAGSPDDLDPFELHAQAAAIVASQSEARRQEVSERMHDRLGTGLVALELSDVLAAAHVGRVDTLFVAVDEHRWGRFDPTSGEIELTNGDDRSSYEDLLDRATVDTLLRRGRVYAVSQQEVPGDTPVAALLRY